MRQVLDVAGDGALLERAIEILGGLISFPSVSATSNLDVVEHICGLLANHDAKIERLRSPFQDKENLWITFGEGDQGGLVLSGHIDVVPVTGQAWTKPAFALTREASKLHGRGTTDMKGFVACALASASLFQAKQLHRPIHLAITFDEEIGCYGARELVDFLKRTRVTPEAIFVGEPTSMAVVDRHKGFAGFTTEIVGKAAHSSLVHLGQNAIQIAAELVGALTSLSERQKANPDESFLYPYPSINLGTINGGNARNIVAADCSFDWEIRPILPAQLDDMRQSFDAHVQDTIDKHRSSGRHVPSISTRLINETPPLVADPFSKATALALRFSEQNGTSAVSFGTEAGIYQEAGYAAVVCGPGDIAQAHTPDEWIEIEQLERCLDFIGRLTEYARQPAGM